MIDFLAHFGGGILANDGGVFFSSRLPNRFERTESKPELPQRSGQR
jgi:hypothetical protein